MLLSKPLNPFLFFHRAPLKASEPISFFSSSHQALSSLKLIIPPISLISPHLSSSSHLHSTPKPKPSPLPAPAPTPGGSGSDKKDGGSGDGGGGGGGDGGSSGGGGGCKWL